MARGADVMDGHGRLAIGLLAQGAAILALDADGVPALLGERDVVDEEDALGSGEGLGEVGAVAGKLEKGVADFRAGAQRAEGAVSKIEGLAAHAGEVPPVASHR